MDFSSFETEAVKTLAGVGVLGWIIKAGVGQLNNALTLDVKVRRRASRTDANKHDAVIEITMKKAPPSRARVTAIYVTLTDVGSEKPKVLERKSEAVTARLMAAMQNAKNLGMVLVTQDSTKYEAHVSLPKDATVEFRIELQARQLVFNWFEVGEPWWSASTVSLPGDVDAKADGLAPAGSPAGSSDDEDEEG